MKDRREDSIMADYKQLYFHLFGCLSTALEHLEHQNYGNAQALLLQVLTEAEDAYLNEGEEASAEASA